MARNQSIYNAELLYVGPSPATGYHFDLNGDGVGDAHTGLQSQSLVKELYRVQSFSTDSEITKLDVFQFGELNAIDKIPQSPTVSCEFEYLVQSFVNERLLGFTMSSGAAVTTCISGFLSKSTDEKNIFAKTVGEGQDAIDNSTTSYYVLGLGNMTLTSYTAQGAVGDFPRATVTFEGQNSEMQSVTSAVTVTGWHIPAVDANGNTILTSKYALPTGVTDPGASPKNYSVLLPGDINFSVGTWQEGFVNFGDMKIQDYNISLDLNRTALERLGSKTAFSREIDLPISATLTVNAIVGDYDTGSLAYNVRKNTPYNIEISINHPEFSYGVANSAAGTPALKYMLRSAYLDSTNMALDVGENKRVTLNFSCPISGPQNASAGFFMSGIN